MRIAMLGRALPRPNYAGGVSGQMHLLSEALVARQHEVTVYALNPPPEESRYQYRRIHIPRAVRAIPRGELYLAPWWMSQVPFDDHDVVHAHGDDHFVRTKLPIVRTFYGSARAEARNSTKLTHRLYHWSMVPLERISERRATQVVSISYSTERYLKGPAPVIPCGYEPGVFFAKGPKSPSPSILFVGDLGTRKRGDLLVRIFGQQIRSTVSEAELWMVTSDQVTGPGIRWFGRLGSATLAQLYRQAWVFCLPSSYEGFGVPYIEAMASGTPVVATPNGGAEEVLDGGRAGRIVKDCDLGNELVALLTNDVTRASLAAAGLEWVKQYEIARIAEQYEAIYKAVIQRRDETAISRMHEQ